MKLLKILLFILFSLSGWLVINDWISFKHYDLYADGKWQSGKTKLGKGVWGGWAMMLSNAALKGGQLNINAWHGYQEITLKKPVQAKTIQFNYMPVGVPFSFIINRTDSGSRAIMFYPKGEQKLCFYTTDISGKFLSKRYSALPVIPESWRQSATIKFTNDSVHVYINRVLASAFPFASLKQINPGFKGSEEYKDLYIDNIEVLNDVENPVLVERFSTPFRIYGVSFWYLLISLAILAYYLYKKQLSAYIVYVSFLSALGVAGAFAYHYYIGCGKYSYDAADINWQGIKSTIETDEMVKERIALEYPVKDIADKKPVVIVMGASQTWGAGASSSKTTFCAVMQDSLRVILNDTNIAVINVAVSAIDPETMYQSYVKDWALYKPKLLIVNASNNEVDTATLKTKLQAITLYNQQHSISTLFVEGPSDGAKQPCEKDFALRAVAGQSRVTSIEMLTYMQQYADSGYCWWDAVHLTDYGHYVFANRILPFAVTEMKQQVPDSTIQTEFAAPAKGK